MINIINKFVISFMFIFIVSGFLGHGVSQGTSLFSANIAIIFFFIIVFLLKLLSFELGESLIFTNVTAFVLLYFSVLSVYFIVTNNNIASSSGYINLILSCFFFAIIYLVINKEVLEFIKKIIPFFLILSAMIMLFDFFNPGSLTSFETPGYNIGRASGLLINANQAGYTLILSMVFIYSFCPKRITQLALMIFIPTILLTFSRSSWLLAILAFTIFYKKINISSIVFSIALLALISTLGLTLFLETSNLDAGILISAFDNIFSRLDVFSIFDSSSSSSSDDVRNNLILFSISEWSNSIFVGNGFGYTASWIIDQGTHNMHLLFLVEFGLLGYILYLTIYLYFLYNFFIQSHKGLKKLNLFIFLFLFFGGFFSHTFLIDYQPLTFLAITSSLNNQDIT